LIVAILLFEIFENLICFGDAGCRRP